jgi:hypothetical protein
MSAYARLYERLKEKNGGEQQKLVSVAVGGNPAVMTSTGSAGFGRIPSIHLPSQAPPVHHYHGPVLSGTFSGANIHIGSSSTSTSIVGSYNQGPSASAVPDTTTKASKATRKKAKESEKLKERAKDGGELEGSSSDIPLLVDDSDEDGDEAEAEEEVEPYSHVEPSSILALINRFYLSLLSRQCPGYYVLPA